MVSSAETRDPQRRVRLLQRLGHDIAQRKIEMGSVVLAAAFLEHRDDRAHRILPDSPLLLEGAVERLELG